METCSIQAYAKLNLTLAVLYKRTDGYHALDSLMQSVSLTDIVTLEKAADVTVTATGALLPYENTLRKAAQRYMAYTGCGARIHVVKRIPSEAGMGGGSADGAAVLQGMQRLYDNALDRGTLFDIALSVGADVPFCLQGGACRAEGVGEVLTPIQPGGKLWFVVAKPAEGVSTKALFSALRLPRENPDTAGAVAALSRGDLPELGKLLGNALEEPAAALVPEIETIRTRLLSAGALGARMTGSGSAVFGLFADEESANRALPAVAEYAFSCVCHSR